MNHLELEPMIIGRNFKEAQRKATSSRAMSSLVSQVSAWLANSLNPAPVHQIRSFLNFLFSRPATLRAQSRTNRVAELDMKLADLIIAASFIQPRTPPCSAEVPGSSPVDSATRSKSRPFRPR
jgi:hypothetical protein